MDLALQALIEQNPGCPYLDKLATSTGMVEYSARAVKER